VRALIAGATGQLGRELRRLLGERVVWAGGSSEIDVCQGDAVARVVRGAQPDVIFNASAYNGVDAAETDSASAFAVNATGPLNLARAAADVGSLLVHFSTDYVFDGGADRPYTEDDQPQPVNVYGVTKLAGEQLVQRTGCQSLIVRTSGVFGKGGSRIKGGSFVGRILSQARAGKRLSVVADQVFCPTYAPDLARAVVGMVDKGARGLFHVTNGGATSWHGLAAAAVEHEKLEVPVDQILSGSLPNAARRPGHSVLSKERFENLGLPAMRSWRDALDEFLDSGV
jgi:dTDP-4-dehydrorhamnose reductase